MPATPDIEEEADPSVGDADSQDAGSAPAQAPWLKYQAKDTSGPWQKYQQTKPVPVPGGYPPVQPSEMAEMRQNDAIKATIGPGTGKSVLTKVRESLSPFLGETESQRLSRPPGALENLDSTGLIPALSKPAVKIPRFTAKSDDSTAAAVAKAAFNVAAGLPEFMESPLGAATAGVGATSKIAGRAIAGGFAADMAAKVPEAARAAGTTSVTGNTQQKAEAILALASQIGMPAALALHAAAPKAVIEAPGSPPARPKAELPPELAAASKVLPRTAEAAKQAIAEQPTTTKEENASDQQKTAAVHGDVQPSAGEGQGEVPPAPDSGGIQPPPVGGLPEGEEANAPGARPETREVGLTPDQVREKYPDTYAGDNADQIPVEIKLKDGSIVPGAVNGIYDLGEAGKKPSVAKLKKNGVWSHGMLGPDESIISAMPTEEQIATGKATNRRVNDIARMADEPATAFTGKERAGGAAIEFGKKAVTPHEIEALRKAQTKAQAEFDQSKGAERFIAQKKKQFFTEALRQAEGNTGAAVQQTAKEPISVTPPLASPTAPGGQPAESVNPPAAWKHEFITDETAATGSRYITAKIDGQPWEIRVSDHSQRGGGRQTDVYPATSKSRRAALMKGDSEGREIPFNGEIITPDTSALSQSDIVKIIRQHTNPEFYKEESNLLDVSPEQVKKTLAEPIVDQPVNKPELMPAGPGAATRPDLVPGGPDLPTDPGNPDVYGVAARVRDQRAKAGQVAPVEAGAGISAPDSVEQGRLLLERGADPEVRLAQFEKDGRFSASDMAVVRAQGERLAQDARSIEEKFGTDSDEYRAAWKKLSDWDARTKPMQTEWHKGGQAQQGETDIDTGTFTGLQRAAKEVTGDDLTPQQSITAKKLASKSKAADESAKAAQGELLKEIAETTKPKPMRIPDAEQRALDAASKTVRDAAARRAEAARRAMEDPQRNVWEKIRGYIEKGMDDLDDIRNKVATDLGMKVDQVSRLMAQNKRVKRLSDDAWRKQQTARRMKEQAKRWLDSLTIPGYQKALKSIPGAMFTLKVGAGLHGFVALGTHAPMVAFQPPFWANYVRDFGQMYKQVFSPEFYERKVQDLVRRPNYVTARRAGLVNDPFKYEEYANIDFTDAAGRALEKLSPKTAEFFNRLMGGGNRGYAILKFLRQDMFDQHWNKLPESAQTPEMAASIANGINHSTGVVKARAPKAANVVMFAPRLMASRAMWLAGDPLKAVDTFARWRSASDADKAFALNQVKEKAWVVGTMAGVLALNQGILAATGSKQKVNLTDPMKSDFLKFKAAGMDFSYGNAMLAMARLPVRLFALRHAGGSGKLAKLIKPDESMSSEAFKYFRSQLSPFAGLLADAAFKGDYENRPLPKMPLSGPVLPMPKRLAARGEKPYTWNEFLTEQMLPIPAEEAAREVWKNGLGMSEKQIQSALKAMATIAIMGGTGGRVSDDTEPKK